MDIISGLTDAALLDARAMGLRGFLPQADHLPAIQAEINNRAAAGADPRLVWAADAPNPYQRIRVVTGELTTDIDTCATCDLTVRRYSTVVQRSPAEQQWRLHEYDDTGRCEPAEQAARQPRHHAPLPTPDQHAPYDGPRPSPTQAWWLLRFAATPGAPHVISSAAHSTLDALRRNTWITADCHVTEAGLRALYGPRHVTFTSDTVARLMRGPASMTVRERTRAKALLATTTLDHVGAWRLLDAEPGGAPPCGGTHAERVQRCRVCGYCRRADLNQPLSSAARPSISRTARPCLSQQGESL